MSALACKYIEHVFALVGIAWVVDKLWEWGSGLFRRKRHPWE